MHAFLFHTSWRIVPCARTSTCPFRHERAWDVDVGKRAMIEVVLNDRLGRKVRVKCNPDDTIGDLKKLVAAQTGTRPERIRIQKWYTVYKDHITLADYEIHDGMGLELYYD
mmetsp:Transcript_5721/g.35634  ORF Transcript_5721/g.35634 Transcript_5721/m.35634 type:complete len:111 (-) Transcript_5721:502-834(-)